MFEETRLVFLGEAGSRVTMLSIDGARSEFADNQWLLIGTGPADRVRLLGPVLVPADIFVQSQNVEICSQGIIQGSRVRSCWSSVVHSGGQQPGRVQVSSVFRHRFQEFCASGSGRG